MTNRTALALLALSTVHCATTEPEGQATSSYERGPGTKDKSPAPAPEAGGVDGPLLRQTGILPGTTNAGPDAVVIFGAQAMDASVVQAAVDSLRTRVRFISQTGVTIGATLYARPVKAEPPDRPPIEYTYTVLVSPETLLPVDQ